MGQLSVPFFDRMQLFGLGKYEIYAELATNKRAYRLPLHCIAAIAGPSSIIIRLSYESVTIVKCILKCW
jgi:hypothetical protein